jgi:hypothetical protein
MLALYQQDERVMSVVVPEILLLEDGVVRLYYAADVVHAGSLRNGIQFADWHTVESPVITPNRQAQPVKTNNKVVPADFFAKIAARRWIHTPA